MPSTCTIIDCKRISCALCHCCHQDICLFHLKEHQDLLICELNPLVDQINLLENRVNTFTVENMTSHIREQLELWRLDCYKKLNEFIEEKYQQLTSSAHKKIDKQRENIDEIRTKLTELMHDQEVTREDVDCLKSKLTNLEQDMNITEQTAFNIHIQPCKIDENLVLIKETNPCEIDLSSLSKRLKTINCTKENWAPIATNEKYLLMHQKPNLCLFDKQFIIIRKTLWTFGEIWDMFWSSALKRFIIINTNTVFLIDDESMSIESIQMVTKHNWSCGTCSNKSLYLATYKRGSSIMEFNLFPTIEYVKHWKSPDTCTRDEGIHDMNYNHEKIFLIIENQIRKTVRVELRSSITFDRLWSLPIESTEKQNVQIRCCLFNDNEWIVANHDLSCLLHITKDGQLKGSCSYTPAPHFATIFGSKQLIIATSKNVNLHKL